MAPIGARVTTTAHGEARRKGKQTGHCIDLRGPVFRHPRFPRVLQPGGALCTGPGVVVAFDGSQVWIDVSLRSLRNRWSEFVRCVSPSWVARASSGTCSGVRRRGGCGVAGARESRGGHGSVSASLCASIARRRLGSSWRVGSEGPELAAWYWRSLPAAYFWPPTTQLAACRWGQAQHSLV